jgi:hypothetical protein
MQRYKENVGKARRAHIHASRAHTIEKNKPLPSDEEAAADFQPQPPPNLDERIHREETELTLLLGCAIKMFLAFRLTDATIKRAEHLMQQYVLLFEEVSAYSLWCI